MYPVRGIGIDHWTTGDLQGSRTPAWRPVYSCAVGPFRPPDIPGPSRFRMSDDDGRCGRGEYVRIADQTHGHGLLPRGEQQVDPQPETDSADTAAPAGPIGRAFETFKAYLALTKPRVIELLLVATVPPMLLANRTIDEPKSAGVMVLLVLSTLFGGWLGAASANTLNCVVDADIDKVMKRTERRPLVRDSVSMRAALVYGILMGLASVLWLGFLVNWLSAWLILATIGFY